MLFSDPNRCTPLQRLIASGFSTYFFRSSSPSPSKEARRTHRDTQWFQRGTEASISRDRAIVIEGVFWCMRVLNVDAPGTSAKIEVP